jgi:hypothetical protein
VIEEAQYPPIIGDWYRDDLGQLFEIVAVDEHDGTIEVQFQDGAVAEYELEAWEAMDVRPADPPEDCYAPYDGQDKDHRGYDAYHPPLWSSPLDDLEKTER